MKTQWVVVLCVCMALTITARGDVLVQWTGTYNTANVNLQGYPGSGNTIPFSMASQRNPVHAGSYYPLTAGTGLNTNFYGGSEVDPATHSLSAYRVGLHATGYSIVQCQAGTGSIGEGTNTTSVWVWKKDDFQSTGYDVVVTSILVYGSGDYPARNDIRTRIVVKQGDAYFISESSGPNAWVYGTNTLLNTLTWYDYSPESSMSGIGGVAAPAFVDTVGGGMSNVTAVGFWQNARRKDATLGGCGTRMNGITALGYVVPEPGVLAALLLAVLALAWRGR